MKEFIIKSEKRALFYSPIIGRRRIYRQNIDNRQDGLKLLIYKRRSRAEEVCAEVNKVYNDTFEVVENP